MKIAHFRWRIWLKPTLTTSFLMAGKISLKKVGKDRLNRSERQREGIFVRSYSESPFLSSSRHSFSAVIRSKTTISPCSFLFSKFRVRERERGWIWCYGLFDWVKKENNGWDIGLGWPIFKSSFIWCLVSPMGTVSCALVL